MTATRLRPIFAISAVLVLALMFVVPASSYLLQFTSPSGVTSTPDHWDFTAFPVKWTLNPSKGSNIQGTRSLSDAIKASFNTWQNAPNTNLDINPDTNTSSKTTSGFDGVNLICFVCQGDFTKEAETLAVTITTVATAAGQSNGHGGMTSFAGQIVDADILFNPSVSFSTDAGSHTDPVQDLQTVATHEIGHFFGLEHSGVVRSLMFPFAPNVLEKLAYDDVAGISFVYPKTLGTVATGSISGTVRFNNNAGPVFGAHVFAESLTSTQGYGPNVRKGPIGTLTFADGSYRIAGLPQDTYVVIAEPLDEPVTNDDVSDFPKSFNKTAVQTNFTTRWH
jgi:hypothetical protein